MSDHDHDPSTPTINKILAAFGEYMGGIPFGHVPKGPCERCKTRPATSWWVGDQSISDLNHGGRADQWCDLCVNAVALENVRKHAARIPELEAERRILLRGGIDFKSGKVEHWAVDFDLTEGAPAIFDGDLPADHRALSAERDLAQVHYARSVLDVDWRKDPEHATGVYTVHLLLPGDWDPKRAICYTTLFGAEATASSLRETIQRFVLDAVALDARGPDPAV